MVTVRNDCVLRTLISLFQKIFRLFAYADSSKPVIVEMRILIVEDEKRMADLLKRGMEEKGHTATVAYDGIDGLRMAESYSFDVIVLDVMLPGIDGFEVARRLQRNENRAPILMLTARDDKADIVKGLDAGADDYLAKPFSFTELLARVRAVSRRDRTPRPLRLHVADLILDPATHEVFRGGKPIPLTKTEYMLLEFMMRNAGRVISRDTIIDAVWGFDETVENNTLDVFVRLLRTKVDHDHRQKLIQTIRGFGYRFGQDTSS